MFRAVRILCAVVLFAVPVVVRAADPAPGTEPNKPPVFHATVELTGIPLVPNPRSNVYAECVVVGEAEMRAQPEGQRRLPAKILIALWGFRDRTLEPAADYEPGMRLELEMIPFAFADEAIRSVQRISEVEGTEAPMFWVRSARLLPAE